MSVLEVGTGRTRVHLTWRRWGQDLHVHVGGGDEHIGAAALVARRSDDDVYEGVLRVPPHREDELALKAARTLHAAAGTNVCVTAGVHVDGITGAEIEEVVRNIEVAIARLAGALRGPRGPAAGPAGVEAVRP
jgi:hypothetical protein